MDTKLSLYDFLAYILPGAIIAILLYWFSISFLALASFSHVSVPDAVSFLLFLILSYFLGHVIQSIGANYQKQKEAKDGWLSERYLLVGKVTLEVKMEPVYRVLRGFCLYQFLCMALPQI